MVFGGRLGVVVWASAIFLGVSAARSEEPPAAADLAAAASAVAPSLVRVEWTLRYDKGEEPQAGGFKEGEHPSQGHYSLDAATPVKEERPLEFPGYLVSPTQVVVTDPMIHPRFVEGVAVRFGDDVVKARPSAYVRGQAAVILELERPLKGPKPLAFDANRKGPYLAVDYEYEDGAWTVGVDAMPSGLLVDEAGRRFAPAPLDAVVVDRKGGPVGLCVDERIPADDSWKGSPLGWPSYSADELARMLAAVQDRTARGILRVTLGFRSPPKDAGLASRFRGGEDEAGVTEMHAAGVLVAPDRILVLAILKPKVTARLDRILVHPVQGDPVPARFACSLTDYGALVATLEKPLPGSVPLSDVPILDCRSLLLPVAEVVPHGEEQSVYVSHRRFDGFYTGWRRHVYPGLVGFDRSVFVFDPQGALLAIPIAHREKVSIEGRYSHSSPKVTPVAYLKEVLADPSKFCDLHNVPVTEEEESRLAWLGAELQPLDKDLARANKVSELTKDGDTGALVSYAYPDSPAAKAGVEAGWILLRLIVEGQPTPLEVELSHGDNDEGPFPWDELDNVSEQFYERIPTPWPSVENSFTRALTDLGFGTKFKAEFFHDGRLITKDFEVAQSPAHYESAPRSKAQALGLTVRDMTYEVRRYFQKKDDESGVIVSKVEPGGKASVAGIKPYEIITHVNEKPVMNVKDFEAAVAGQDVLRLSVKRMTRGRVVKIVMNGSAPAPASSPAADSGDDKPSPAKSAARQKAGPPTKVAPDPDADPVP